MGATPTNKFSDIDLNFAKNPLTKDVNIVVDENAIKRSLRNLIQTNTYERPFSCLKTFRALQRLG